MPLEKATRDREAANGKGCKIGNYEERTIIGGNGYFWLRCEFAANTDHGQSAAVSFGYLGSNVNDVVS